MANYVSKIRAEFDARQASEAMYALSERARGLNKLLAEQRKRWEQASDQKVKDSIDGNIKRLEAELASVEKLNRTIEKSFTTESAFQQVLTKGTGSMSVSRLEGAQRNARAILRNINPSDEGALDQLDEAQRVINESGKRLASLKNGFMDAMQTVQDGVEGKALPELKRLEAALTEAQKFSVDQNEWNSYAEAIGKVKLEMQSAAVASVQMEEQNAKVAASLKYGFEDAYKSFSDGIDQMALPELNRLEAALTETQKYSFNAEEWQKYGAAIDAVRQKVQGITGEYLSVKDAMGYAEQISKQTFTGTIADLERAKKLLTDYRRTLKQTGEGAAELKKVDENLEVIERQIKGTYLTTEKFNEILRHPKGKSFEELKNAIEQAEKQIYSMRRETDEERKAFLALHEQIQGAKDELKEFGEAQDDAGVGMEELKEKAKQLAGAYLSLQGLQEVWQANLDLSDQMAAVRKTTGMTAEQIEMLTERIKEIDTRAANEQLMSLAATAGQLGLQAEEDVLGFTKAANQITVSLDELGDEGVLQLMKVAQVSGALQKEGGDVETTLLKVGSAINELSASSSATAGPITDFIGRVGGVASTAKMSMSEIAALGATTDALAISAELAGTQINVFLGGMQKNTKAVAELLGVSKDYVQGMLDNGQAMDLFVQIVDKMGTLNANQLDNFLKEMGSSGSRATQVFSTLSKNVDQLRANLEVSNDAYEEGISITDEYNKVNETAAAKWERLTNKLKEFFVTADNTSWLSSAIDGVRELVDLLTEEGPIGSFFRFTLLYLALMKAKWTETIGTALISLGKYMFATKAATAATVADTAAKTADTAATGALATATEAAAVKTNIFAQAWGKLNKVQRANVIMAVATAVLWLGTSLLNTSKKAREAARQLGALEEAEKKAKEESVKERAELERLYKATQDQTKSIDERKKALKDMVGDEKYKQYYQNLSNEKDLASAAAKAYGELATEIIKAAKARVYQQKIEELAEKNVALEDRIEEDQRYVNERKADYDRVSTNVANTPSAASIYGTTAAAAESHNDGRRQFLREYEQKQQDIIDNQEQMKQNDADILKLETKIKNIGAKPATEPEEESDSENNRKGGNGGGQATTTTPSEYNKMSADQLKNRKKQMKEFAGSIGTDADVQSLLKEDTALKKAIEKGMSSDIQTVINWYNQERLKIQDELHARHLTNTGDFMDPKKQKARKKMLHDETKAFLDEIDAYYTERKAHIQEAQTEEGLSEEEAQRQIVENEVEWRQRRMELLQMYGGQSAKVVGEEQDAIFRIIADRLNEDVDYVKAVYQKTVDTVKKIGEMNEQGALEAREFNSKMDRQAMQELLKQQNTTAKQMQAIHDIIAKERPYDGIVDNLRKNLTTMGILFADMEKANSEAIKKGLAKPFDDGQIVEQRFKRLEFVMRQVEEAYDLSITDLIERMKKEGFGEWAKAIESDDQMQQAMLAQLHQTYDAVQDAIKKESSLIKKHVEMQWADIAKGQTMSLKDQYEAAINALGMQQDSVSRANSLIGAGEASNRVADKLAIRQLQIKIDMQHHYYLLMQAEGQKRLAFLQEEEARQKRIAEHLKQQAAAAKAAGKTEEAKRKTREAEEALTASTLANLDAEHLTTSLNLSKTKEQTEQMKLQKEIADKVEEMQNRLYEDLKSWADLLTSSLQGVFEASHTADREYYNERAKLDLTGKGGPGAGTYIVIENEGTEDAKARYEYLDERQALERQREIENDNAVAEAWKKMLDDLNQKMSDTITDQLNAMLQAESIDKNTQAVIANTAALWASTGVEKEETSPGQPDAMPVQPQPDRPSAPVEPMSMPSATPAPASTDQENTIATNANTAALNTLTQLLGGQPAAGTAGTTDTGTVAAGGTPMPADGEVQAQKPFFQMSQEETDLAMERIQQLWQAYNDGGVTALQEMAATLAETEGVVLPPWQITEEGLEAAMERMGQLWQSYAEQGIEALQMMSDAMDEMPNKAPNPMQVTEEQVETSIENMQVAYQGMADASGAATEKVVADQKKTKDGQQSSNNQIVKGSQSAFAKMTQAANLYGIAYQAMSNDNISAAQKFEMMAVQAAGQSAIAMLTTDMATSEGKTAAKLPGILGQCIEAAGPYAGPVLFAVISGVLGGLLGLAVSKIAKSKSTISKATGSSASGGRLSTGMLTYAEGNVDEFTDPKTLTPGRSYNVDAADGRTYRAKYTGTRPQTHLTGGPEFHLAGERGREMIIDADTTRQITMNEAGIWHAIQTLSGGGRLRHTQRRGRGVHAFADGNMDEFEEIGSEMGAGDSGMGGMGTEQMAAFQSSLDRNNELLERALTEGIHARFDVYGKGGLIDSYDQGKKTVARHGERY